MKTTNEIFDNIERKIKIRQTAKNKTIKRILSLATSIILLISIPIIVSVAIFNNTSKPNTIKSDNSANSNSATGLISEYNSINITYEELLANISKNQGFSLLIPKNSQEITSISNIFHVEYNQTHYFDVSSNTKTSYWSIRYYNYGINSVHKNYENYLYNEKIEFNGANGYVTYQDIFSTGTTLIFVFDFGEGKGVSFRYNASFEESHNPIQVLKDIFIEIEE